MTKNILVDLTSQMLTARDGTTIFHTCECVTGDASHPTPQGLFSVNRKCNPYTSHTYHVPMNFAMFFTHTGEALHQYHGPAPWWLLRAGRGMTTAVGSHGCVRLQEADARKLYDWAPIGTSVHVR